MSIYKVLVVGEPGVGKTSLTNKIVYNTFSNQYRTTIGCEFSLMDMNLEGEEMKIQLWDLAGVVNLGGMSHFYCKNTSAAIIVADITNAETIRKTIEWKNKIDENIRLIDGTSIPTLLLLNKSDLASTSNLSENDIAELVQTSSIGTYFKTSAKDGTNLDQAMKVIAKKMKNKEHLSESNIIRGQNLHNNKKKKKFCC